MLVACSSAWAAAVANVQKTARRAAVSGAFIEPPRLWRAARTNAAELRTVTGKKYAMRPFLVLALALCALAAVPALAQTNPPGYTALDAAQQAKLQGHVGTWQCSSVPPGSPVSVTETQQGNWFVARRSGDPSTGSGPATSYERWSHALKAYVLIAIFDSGASDVAQTISLDPDNATLRFREPET